jgi:hypothetical protein
MLELKDVVADKLRSRPLDSEIDRDELVARAMAYIDEASLIAAPPAAASLVEI